MAHATDDIRNIALVGHGTCGKTSLAEAMLFRAKATARQGSPDEGTSILDHEEQERERKFTIDSAIAHCAWKGRELNIIDAPGYQDFIGEAIAALEAVDLALFVIDANAGIKINTRTLWDIARRRGIPRAVILNRLDMDHADYDKNIEQFQSVFGDRCIPLTLPDGSGGAFSRVEGSFTLAEGASDRAKAVNEKLLEAVIEVDDALLERYFNGEELSPQELAGTFTRSLVECNLHPVLATSVLKDIGVEQVLDFVADFGPSPRARPLAATNAGGDALQVDVDGPFAARVFKSVYDPFVGKLSFLRVYAGTLEPGGSFLNRRSEESCKVGHVYRSLGKENKDVPRAVAGDIVTLAKIEDLKVSDTLTAASLDIRYPAIAFPRPMVSLAVEPKSRADEQKIFPALTKMADSDPTFRALRDRQTADMVISGMSDLHLLVVLSRLRRRDVEVTTRAPKIPYLETITGSAESAHKHKKQTGGRGQYGEVHLRIKARERGEGFEFVDKVVGGVIPRQYIPAVEKGIVEACARGIQAGFQVVDVSAEVFFGSYHDVDSSEAAFKMAASKAFVNGCLQARPVILEPIYMVEVTIPDEFMGAITGDLNSRRGRIQGMDSSDGQQVVKAAVPLSEIQTYSTELRSMTGGEGTYRIEFSHYDVCPPPIAQQIIQKYATRREED